MRYPREWQDMVRSGVWRSNVLDERLDQLRDAGMLKDPPRPWSGSYRLMIAVEGLRDIAGYAHQDWCSVIPCVCHVGKAKNILQSVEEFV